MDIHGVIPPDQFPPMRQQPSYAKIMACLNTLRASKADNLTDGDGDDDEDAGDGDDDVWDCATPRDEIEASLAANALYVQRYANAISRYLGSIIMSDLGWLPSEDDRESLWTVASRRIAERCGRTAMGDITRRWPLMVNDDGSGSDEQARQVNLIIKEPALVGDSLGFKTWGTSYAMAQMLPALIKTPGLRHLEQPVRRDGVPVLELGAGTGLLGLAAAVLWRANVVLSDLATIVPNLAANVERNAKSIAARNRDDGKGTGGGGHARARAGVLQWGAARNGHDSDNTGGDVVVDPDLFPRDHMFPLVIVADPIYDKEHPALLASAIDANLAREEDDEDGNEDGNGPSPRAVVMVPLRDRQTEKMAAMFVAAMADRRLVPVDEGDIAAQDSDWGSSEGKGAGAGSDFTCSWWVFHRQ